MAAGVQAYGKCLAGRRFRMRSHKLWLIGAGLLLALVAYAWVDGGREPVHEIAVPVAVPGEPR